MQPNLESVEVDCFSCGAVVYEAAHLPRETYEELRALPVRMRAAHGFARHVVYREEAARCERQTGELGGHQATAKITRARERVQGHASHARLRDASDTRCRHGDLRRCRFVFAVDVGDDGRRIAADDRIRRNALSDDGTGLDDGPAPDDDSRRNSDVRPERRKAPNDHFTRIAEVRRRLAVDDCVRPNGDTLLEANTTQEPCTGLHVDVVLEYHVAHDDGVVAEDAVPSDFRLRPDVNVR